MCNYSYDYHVPCGHYAADKTDGYIYPCEKVKNIRDLESLKLICKPLKPRNAERTRRYFCCDDNAAKSIHSARKTRELRLMRLHKNSPIALGQEQTALRPR